MLTVLGNLRINSQEKLEHLKHSLFSFKGASDNWLINVRGEFREEALIFLRRELREQMQEFTLLDDNRGWVLNALEMLSQARHDYILVWNEDHINLAPVNLYSEILKELKANSVDYMLYTWWGNGDSRKAFSKLPLKEQTTVDTLYLTTDFWKQALANGHHYYLISMCGIFRKDLLEKIMREVEHPLPYICTRVVYKALRILAKVKKLHVEMWYGKINALLGHRLVKYPKVTPFNIEKEDYRTDLLPLTVALPRQELFCCIDDNLGIPGSSLLERGLYPASTQKCNN